MEHRDLLKKWKEKKAQEAKAQILKAPDSVDSPMSYGQQRLWVLQKLFPDNPFYHFCELYKFSGAIDQDILIKAFDEIGNKHSILRTTFSVDQEGYVVQKIHQDFDYEFIEHRFDSSVSKEKEQFVNELVHKEGTKSFDLQNGPLIRLVWIHIHPTECFVAFIMHHIITDKHSMQVLRNELSNVYRAMCRNEYDGLKSLNFQYSDFSYWQRNLEHDPKQMNYWIEKLKDFQSQIELPTDYDRPKQPAFKGKYALKKFSRSLSRSIQEEARKNNTTNFVIFLAAYKLLLHRLCDHQKIAVGSPVSNRQIEGMFDLVGFFNETLVLATDFSKIVTWKELLTSVKSTVLEAFDNKDIPFDLLVQKLNPERSGFQNPLFQVMFLYHKVPVYPAFGEGIKFDYIPFDLGVSKFDLTLYIEEKGKELSAIFEYNTEIFSSESIDRFHSYYQTLLGNILLHPGAMIHEIDILNDDDRTQILETFNDTNVEFKAYEFIYDLIHEQLVHNSGQIALSDQNTRISYKQLMNESSRIAQFLIDLPGSNDIPVGLLLDRSMEMVIAILGVLQSGRPYLALDPKYPENRIGVMLKEAKVQYLITEEELKNELTFQDIRLITLSEIKTFAHTFLALDDLTEASQLAYIVFTSGSTGIPKGVKVSHQNLINSTLARFHYYPEKPRSFLLLSSFTFDSSVAGIYWALCSGAKLVIPPDRIEQDIIALAELIKKEQISHTLLLPSLYELLLEFAPLDKLISLKAVVVAGEACSAHLVQMHKTKLPDVKLYNEYGPSEATVWSTVEDLTESTIDSIVPIGKPIANTRIYILDENLRPVPISIHGEMFIAGQNVGEGYLNSGADDGAKFFWHQINSKKEFLYRTGDLAKYRQDGTIDFLGRADEQIKIRGHRVELEEIKKHLRSFPGVTQVEIVKSMLGKAVQLRAFIVSEDGISIEGIRNKLKNVLPEYMIPSVMIEIQKLPVLPNGKIDRKQLAGMEIQVEQEVRYEGPQTELEEKLLEIWSEVLQIQSLGVRDDFFDLGGDSIMSIQIIAKARKNGLLLKPNAIFEYPTIRELAKHIERYTAPVEDNFDPGEELILSPIQHWFFKHFVNIPEFWNQAVLIELNMLYEANVIKDIVTELVKHHKCLRLRFRNSNGTWTPFLSDNIDEFKFLEISSQKHNVSRQLNSKMVDLQKSIDLEKNSLFNVLYTREEESQSVFVTFVAHHLIIDIISWKILIDDFNTLLQGSGNSKLLIATNSFQSWTSYLKKISNSKEILLDLDYWNEQCSCETSLFRGKQVTKALEKDKETIIKVFSYSDLPEIRRTILSNFKLSMNELLVSIFVKSLMDWKGNDQITIAFEKHGREHLDNQIDLSGTIGWFTSFFPVHFALDLNSTFEDLFISVKETLRNVPKGGVSYGVLKYLSDDPEYASNLNFSAPIVFNYSGKEQEYKSPQIRSTRFLFENTRDPLSEYNHLLELNLNENNEELLLRCSFSNKFFKRSEIDVFTKLFENNLLKLGTLKDSIVEPQYSTSDFPDVDIDQDDLDALLDSLRS